MLSLFLEHKTYALNKKQFFLSQLIDVLIIFIILHQLMDRLNSPILDFNL